jgi:poly(3-hydroxybutyrate) depolymerase
MRSVSWAAAFVALACAYAQPFAGGPQVTTIQSAADGTQQPVALYVPPRLDPKRKYPLVVALHEVGSNHKLNLRRLFGRGNLPGESNMEASRVFPHLGDFDVFAVAPFARGYLGFEGIAERDVYTAVEWMKKTFPIDPDRVYLTGIYTGATAALRFAESNPSVWAAVAVICPAPAPDVDRHIGNLRVPVRIYHGERDILVSPSSSRHLQKLLVDQGTPVEYIEYPGGKHNAWDAAYREGAIFDWFAGHKRNAFPSQVVFQTSEYRHSSAWWVELTGLTPGESARVDAKMTARNKASIDTSGVFALTLHLAGHPLYQARTLLDLRIDGQSLRTRAISFRKTSAGWKPEPYKAAPGAKRQSLEGPIADVLATRHLYVYGSGGNERQVNEWRDQAMQAAQWSTRRERIPVAFPVVADFELSEHDTASANLVLFGNRETNRVIAKLAPRLPMELSPSAVDYGLAFVSAVDGRYVVVNSGLNWWRGAELVESGALPPFRVLQRFGDFVLFKGSLDNILAEGRFDNNWKLPAEAAHELAASGAIRFP